VGALWDLFCRAVEVRESAPYRGLFLVAKEKEEEKSACCDAPMEWFSAFGHAVISREFAHYGRCSQCKKVIYLVERKKQA